ncbi:aminodeoxychorismate/anthranilate synthase component II [bacterium]|nr:MAG: aminodeoxychorismate/anthranilate synthase component II [bacterium]
MVLIIDNYDSFTFNIYQSISTMVDEVRVVRNDQITVEELKALPLTHLIISPGPGRPDNAGISKEAIRLLAGKIPVLGVCLGHQAIGEVFGCDIVHAAHIMHGKASSISHPGEGVFAGLPSPFEAIRYHSLSVERSSVPEELEITAEADDGEIMGIRHRTMAVEGVQFHPESFGTLDGDRVFENFLNYRGGVRHAA